MKNNFAYTLSIDDTREAKLHVEGKKLYKSIVINGNFETGIGWTGADVSINTVSNNVITNTTQPGATYGSIYQSGSHLPSFKAGTKIYGRARLRRITDSSDGMIAIQIRNSSVQSFKAEYNVVKNQWYDLSGLITSTGPYPYTYLRIINQFSGEIENEQMEASDFIVIVVDELIDDKVYSPLFDKTFDLLTDLEMEAQMDVWTKQEKAYIAAGNYTSFRGIPRGHEATTDYTSNLIAAGWKYLVWIRH